MKKKEREILKGFAKRDNKVVKQFINDHYENIGNYLKSKGASDDDVDEILHQGLISIFDLSKIKNIKLKGRVVDYFFGVVNNQLKHKFREIRKRRFINYEGKIFVDKGKNIEQLMIMTERFDFIDENLEKAGKDCKKLFDFIIDGFKTEEIMEKMNYTAECFYKKTSLCKKNLLIKMKKDRRFNELFDEHI